MNQSIAQAAANLRSHAGRKERKRQEREEALARIEKQRRRKVRAIRAQENSADAAAQPNVLPLPPPPLLRLCRMRVFNYGIALLL